MDELQKELAHFARSLGIDLFGVAELTAARSFIRDQGGEHIAGYP